MSTTKVARFLFPLVGLFLLVFISLLSTPAPAQARAALQMDDGSKCIGCHENLYYLHDTGKSYCLKDSPMACVDCHGGDPSALTKEAAHFNRAAHPVINEDDKKCYECHPAAAEARLDQFRQVAGIDPVIVSAPCPPAFLPLETPISPPQVESWLGSMEMIALLSLSLLAIAIFFAVKVRHG